MKNNVIKANIKNIAFCGLYCEACGKYKNGKCPGCAKNEKASWCGIRKCCLNNEYKSCADCSTYPDPMKCKLYNNPISRVIGFVLRSNRSGCIEYIRENGYENYAEHMASEGNMTMKR